MPYLYLLCAICFSAALSILGTLYNNKNAQRPNVSRLYSLMTSCSVFISWLVIYAFDFSFAPGVIIYSLAYGIFYTMAMLGLINALNTGSVSLTAFVKQLSLACVAFWGFFFWDTPFTFNVAIGLILIVIALSLCLFNKDKKGDGGLSWKWFLFALMLLIGNAGCSIMQKYQQAAFDGQHGSMMMAFATGFAVLINLIVASKEDKTHWKDAIRASWGFPAAAGLSSALTNQFILLLISTSLSASLVYPGIAVGGLMLTVLVSVVVCNEKLRRQQWIGLAVGAVALIFLNL